MFTKRIEQIWRPLGIYGFVVGGCLLTFFSNALAGDAMTVEEIQKAAIDKGVNVLKNIGLSAGTARADLEQQNEIANDEIANSQALFQLKYATIAKCIEVLMSIDPDKNDASNKINAYKGLMDQFVDMFHKMEARKPTNKKEQGLVSDLSKQPGVSASHYFKPQETPEPETSPPQLQLAIVAEVLAAIKQLDPNDPKTLHLIKEYTKILEEAREIELDSPNVLEQLK